MAASWTSMSISIVFSCHLWDFLPALAPLKQISTDLNNTKDVVARHDSGDLEYVVGSPLLS